MKPEVKAPELAKAIEAHARAVLAGNIDAAERYVVRTALEAYRTAIAEASRLGPFDRYEAPGFARAGTHYISKIRLSRAAGSALMQIRWKREVGGDWVIAEAEYFPAGRNPWSGVKPPRPASRAASGVPDHAKQ